MANNEKSKTPPSTAPEPRKIPLEKIHNLPGTSIFRQPDFAYGGLVTSIRSKGVQDPVILRPDGKSEYQLVAGYRRKRACELAGLKEIPAHVYDMTLQEAQDYKSKNQPHAPIPGKLIPEEKADPAKAEVKPLEKAAESKATEKTPAEKKPDSKAAEIPAEKKPEEKAPTAEAAKKPNELKAPDKAGEKAPEALKADAPKPPEKPQEKPPVPKPEDKPRDAKAPKKPAPKVEDKPKEEKKPEPSKDEKKETEKKAEAPKTEPKKAGPAKALEATVAAGPAAKGPMGTSITKVLGSRLSPPDDKARKALELPKGDEAFSVILHPTYLKKADINQFSVDRNSDDFKELYKSIENFGVKDPVLARPGKDGTLEIISGQRRHLIASELNYPVPAIIQNISDDDAQILVADGNLHREKISTYDMSRALKMKMEAMKRKSGRRKKGEEHTANADEALAKEMGMGVSKLNRIVRLSEACREVCDRVDDNSLPLSIAYAVSFLKPENQDKVLDLMDIGYKLSTDRIERMKKLEKSGKLDESMMRDVLDDKDLVKPTPPPVIQPAPAPAPVPTPVPPISTPSSPGPSAPVSAVPSGSTPTAPGINSAPNAPATNPANPFPVPSPTPDVSKVINNSVPQTPASEPADDPFKGEQEKPYVTRIILTGDRLRKYFPDVEMTPREIEESVYEALEERRQRQEKQKQKTEIFKPKQPSR